MSIKPVNFSAIKITEEEDLFLLTKIDQALALAHPSAQLFIVGDWPRSKKFNKTSYHYELICPTYDFKSISDALLQQLSPAKVEPLFKPYPQVAKKSKKTTSKRTDSPNLLIRLYSINGNKFKVTLDVLIQDSLLNDLHQRDFSINALYCDLRTKNLIFYKNIQSDFENRFLRTLKPPAETFKNQINIIFRLVEFSARYKLKISEDIYDYFATLDTKTEIYQTAMEREHSNFLSSVNKFFSKHYVGEMIALMSDLRIIDIFLLEYPRREEFGQRLCEVLPLLERLQQVFQEDIAEPLDEIYKEGLPKVFFTKTRMYLIALFIGLWDKCYALQFLRLFVYNDKNPSSELKRLLTEVDDLLTIGSGLPETDTKQLRKLESTLREMSFDKSQWGFYIVFQIIRDYLQQQNRRKNCQISDTNKLTNG